MEALRNQRQVVINVHHLADQIIELYQRKNKFNMAKITIAASEKEKILGTGGGLIHARNAI